MAIKKEVATLNIPESKKTTVIQKAIRSLSNTSTSTPKNHFTSVEKKRIIQENCYQALKGQSSSMSDAAKRQIHTQVATQVNSKLKIVNQDINATIAKIKSFAINEYGKAFTKLYSHSIVFVLLSAFTCFLFPEKKVENNKL